MFPENSNVGSAADVPFPVAVRELIVRCKKDSFPSEEFGNVVA